EVAQGALDQRRQGGEADEELAQIMEAELFGVLKRVHPTPVDDLPLAHREPDEVEAEDADRVEDPLTDPALIEVAEAGAKPGEECRYVGVVERDGGFGHDWQVGWGGEAGRTRPRPGSDVGPSQGS